MTVMQTSTKNTRKNTKIFPYNLAYYAHALVSKTSAVLLHPSLIALFPILFTRTTSIYTYMDSKNAKAPPVTMINYTEVFPTLLGSAADALSHLSW